MTQKQVDLLKEFIENPDPVVFERKIFDLNYFAVAEVNTALAEMMKACAIPKSFNEEIIGVLRGRLISTENKKILNDLTGYSFVESRSSSNDFVYRDATRNSLLDDWRRQENVETYQIYVSRLLEFYKMRLSESVQSGDSELVTLGYLNQALYLKPDDLDLLERRMEVYLRQQDYRAALRDIGKLLKSQIARHDLYYKHGVSSLGIGNLSQALADLNLAIEIFQNKSEYYRSRANVFIVMGDYRSALSDITYALKFEPAENTALYFQRAQIHMYTRLFEDAKADIERVINRSSSDFPEAYLYRAIINYQLGLTQDALDDAEKFTNLSPDDINGYIILRRIHRDTGNQYAALEAMNRAIDANPNSLLYHMRARVYRDLKQYDNALADLNKAIELDPTDSSVFATRSHVNYLSANLHLSKADIDKAIEIDPDKLDYYLLRRRINRDMKDNSSALMDTDHMIRLSPEDSNLFYMRARIDLDMDNISMALRDITSALTLDKNNWNLYSFRGYIYYSLGLFEKALSDIDAAVGNGCTDLDVILLRRRINRDLGDNHAALRDSTLALNLDENSSNRWKRLYDRARVYVSLKDYNSALSDLTEALKLNPGFADMYFFRGRIYEKISDHASAKKDFIQAEKLKKVA